MGCQQAQSLTDGSSASGGSVNGNYARAALVLRLLADSDESTHLVGSDDPMCAVLRTAADACEQVEELQQAPIQTRARVADLEDLLSRVAAAIEGEPLPAEGGSWTLATLAQEIRRTLNRKGTERHMSAPSEGVS